MKRNLLIGLGVVGAIIAILYVQRDFLYGVRGNMGQGTHPFI